jgi:DNA modification methylase
MTSQLGLEASPHEYVDHLVQVFNEIRRALRDDGSCWVVLGDTYFGSSKGVGSNGPQIGNFQFQRKPTEVGGTAKSLALIPSRFAIAMTGKGWILRNRIIWHKPNGTPASVKDRFSVDFEEMFFFTKSKQYYFEQQFVPFSPATVTRIRQFARNGERFDPARHKGSNSQGSMAVLNRFAASMKTKKGANMRTVWTIPVARCVEAHYAVYPERLIETPIKAGCPVGGTVIDPFSGAGTTGIVCERLGRSFVGIELNPAYVEIAKKRIRDARERR